MFKKNMDTKPNELRFPNRYIVDDYPDGDQSRVMIHPGKMEQLGFF